MNAFVNVLITAVFGGKYNEYYRDKNGVRITTKAMHTCYIFRRRYTRLEYIIRVFVIVYWVMGWIYWVMSCDLY